MKTAYDDVNPNAACDVFKNGNGDNVVHRGTAKEALFPLSDVRLEGGRLGMQQEMNRTSNRPR